MDQPGPDELREQRAAGALAVIEARYAAAYEAGLPIRQAVA